MKSNECNRKALKSIEFDAMPPKTEVSILTAQEAAAMLRMSEATVRRLIRQGKLPGTRIGRDYRIPLSQLLKSLYSPQ